MSSQSNLSHLGETREPLAWEKPEHVENEKLQIVKYTSTILWLALSLLVMAHKLQNPNT
jgi:hypothetical protein